jgi:signal transduction histidine kinase
MNFRFRVAAWFSLSVLLLAGALVFSAHWHLDGELRKDRWDRTHPGFPEWVIHGSYTDEEVHDILGELVQVWLWVGLPLIFGSVLAGLFIAKRSIRPIRQMNQELEALDFRSLSKGVRLPESDPELSALVNHINALLKRLHASYSEMEAFSARVAHELRTPLTILRMKTEAAASRLPEDFSEELQEEIHRLSRVVENTLLAAKAECGNLEVSMEPIDFSSLLEDLREGYELLAAEQNLEVHWKADAGIFCIGDPARLRQMLHNLLANAVKHGTRSMKVRAKANKPGHSVCVRISNWVDPAAPAKMGTSMGLRIVRALGTALPGVRVQTRKRTNVFSVRLTISSPSKKTASPSCRIVEGRTAAPPAKEGFIAPTSRLPSTPVIHE